MNSLAFAFFLAGSFLVLSQAHGADDQASNLSIGATAPAKCIFTSAPRQLNSSNMTVTSAATGASSIVVDELVDANTSQLQVASIELELLGVCNKAHYLSLKSIRGGLSPQDVTPALGGSFLQHINYKAEISWAGRTATLVTDETPGQTSSAGFIEGPNSGPLNLTLTIDGTVNDMTLPTAEGVYSDALIVQIGVSL